MGEMELSKTIIKPDRERISIIKSCWTALLRLDRAGYDNRTMVVVFNEQFFRFHSVYLQTLWDHFCLWQVCSLALARVIVLVNIPTVQIMLLPAFQGQLPPFLSAF